MRKSRSRLLPLFGLLAVVVLSAVALVVAMGGGDLNLDLRRWASGQNLDVTLSNSSLKIKPKQAVTVDLLINTKGRFISGVQFSGTITGVDQDQSGVVISQISGLNPVFSEVKKVGSDLQFKFVELASLGGAAFTTHDQNQKLATFNLYPLKSGEVKLAFDQNQSGAMEFGKEFLTSGIGQKSYAIEITDGSGGSGSNAPPDGGIHRGCNEYCADSRECASEFSCWYNRCRNPRNLPEEKCTDPVVVQPTTTKPVTTVSVQTSTQNAQNKGGATQPSPTPAMTVATVIITRASSSAQVATSSSLTPSPTPVVSPATTSTTRNLGSNPSPSPVQQPTTGGTSRGSSNLGLLIGAAIVTGILAFVAILFFLKNRNSNYQPQ